MSNEHVATAVRRLSATMPDPELVRRATLGQWSWVVDGWPALTPADKAWIQEHWELADGPIGPRLVSSGPEWSFRDWWWLIPIGVGSVAWWVLCIVMGWY